VTSRAFDAVVIGAGLGGLLAAAFIAKRGGSVLVLERLSYPGGRFTTVNQDDYAITTGALHMAPHGDRGPLARAFKELGVPFRVVPRDVPASFYYRGQHVLWQHQWDLLRLFSAQGRLDMLKITALLSAPLSSRRADALPFSDWLRTQTSDAGIHHFFESFVQFAVSVCGNQISFGEMRAIHQNVLRYGMPGIPVGGCNGLIGSLVAFIGARGGEIRTTVDVTRIRAHNARVTGVEFRHRSTRQSHALECPLVVSDAGPERTRELLQASGDRVLNPNAPLARAAGLKLHIVSDKPLVPHNGIMFCMDTRRVSGLVEVSRALPAVVPPGKHMIDTFQVMRSDSLTLERDLAIADLRDIFGADYDRHSRIVRTSAFRAAWPVNQARQGHDLANQEPLDGLLMVGDAYKPKGHMMAEGVAASVTRLRHRLA
jgi:phytoene dehydrogenase-like protein